MGHNKGRKAAGQAAGKRAARDVPGERGHGLGQSPQRGFPEVPFTEAQGLGHREGLFLKCVKGLKVLCGISLGERVNC